MFLFVLTIAFQRIQTVSLTFFYTLFFFLIANYTVTVTVTVTVTAFYFLLFTFTFLLLTGNDIIQKLQSENKQLRGKLKIKSKVLRRQEDLVSEKEHEIDDYHRTQLSLEAEVKRGNNSTTHLQTEVKRLNKKLEESKQLLASNQQVIKWLNQEINNVQLNGRRGNLGPSAASLGIKELESSSAFRFTPRQTLGTINTAASQYRPIEKIGGDENNKNGTFEYKPMSSKIKSIHAPATQTFNAAGMFGEDVPLPLQSAP